MIIEYLQGGTVCARYYPETGQVLTAGGELIAQARTRQRAHDEVRGFFGGYSLDAEQPVNTSLLSIEPGWEGTVIPRHARKQHDCICADPFRPGWKITVRHGPGHWSSSYRPDKPLAQRQADIERRRYPKAEVTVTQDPNPEYRPDCLRIIQKGDAYAEYLGEAPAYQSGTRYCARCTAAVWGKQE